MIWDHKSVFGFSQRNAPVDNKNDLESDTTRTVHFASDEILDISRSARGIQATIQWIIHTFQQSKARKDEAVLKQQITIMRQLERAQKVSRPHRKQMSGLVQYPKNQGRI